MIVLDTNVLSELMRPHPSAAVVRWTAAHSAIELFTTAVTEAEIFNGIELAPKGKRRDALLTSAEQMFAFDFAGRVLSFDGDSARAFARIAARRLTIGKPISQADAQIAAITLTNGATLATRNVGDFEGCNLRLIDPWRG